MSKKKSQRKVRTEFKKRHQSRRRQTDLTRKFHQDASDVEDLSNRERVSGKGDLTRHRTIVGQRLEDSGDGLRVEMDIDDPTVLEGRVIRVSSLSDCQNSRLYPFNAATRYASAIVG